MQSFTSPVLGLAVLDNEVPRGGGSGGGLTPSLDFSRSRAACVADQLFARLENASAALVPQPFLSPHDTLQKPP